MSHYTYEIIGGILIFLSSLVSEAFPKRLRIALWALFAVLAVAYTGCGIHLDKEAATKAQRERTTSENETKDLKSEIQGLRTNTSNLISTIAGMFPMVASLNADLATLRRDTAAAKEHHDPQVINALERQAQTAQQQVDSLSHELLAITMAPQVAQQLRDWEGERKYKQSDLHNRAWEDERRFRDQHPNDSEGLSQIDLGWQAAYEKADDDATEQLKRTVATADFIRKQMLQQIPLQQRYAEDKRQEQEFAQAKNNPESLNTNNAAQYLEDLARRVPPPK